MTKNVVLFLSMFLCALMLCSCQNQHIAVKEVPATAPKKPHVKKIAKNATTVNNTVKVHIRANVDRKSVKTVAPMAQIVYLTTLNEVLNLVDAIVVGRPTQDFISRDHYATFFEDGFVNEGWTQGDLTVDTVLYEKPGTGLVSGQSIRYTEPVSLMDYGSAGVIKEIIDNCSELKQNRSYVLFLDKQDDGAYWALNFNLGRFNIDGTDSEDEPGGNTIHGQPTDKQRLRDELTSQYGITFNLDNFPLPPARIVDARLVQDGPLDPLAKYVPSVLTISVDGTQTEGAEISVEKKEEGQFVWTVLQPKTIDPLPGQGSITMEYNNAVFVRNTAVRVRVVNGNRASLYSSEYQL